MTRSERASGWWHGGARARRRAASGRLRAAHDGFERSMIALRKAALDHVDCQDVASVALQAVLSQVATQAGGDEGHPLRS